jgi:hypothetical protein
MKTLLLFLALIPSAFADSRVVPHIEHALGTTRAEYAAIYSGRYTSYRPETIRSIISSLLADERAAAQLATDSEGRAALRDLDRSLSEEYQYSFRFGYYRLASTELLLRNWERLFRLALQSETQHGSRCNVDPASRVGCLN